IPRPPNAWVLFRAFWVNKVKESNKELKLVYKAEQTTLSTLLSIEWAALPDDERQKWFRMAYEKKLEHKRLYPNYRYQPQKKVTSVRKNAVAKKAS
ncbi:high mobility group box domain-containing protein, partial [Cyathus striatus]